MEVPVIQGKRKQHVESHGQNPVHTLATGLTKSLWSTVCGGQVAHTNWPHQTVFISRDYLRHESLGETQTRNIVESGMWCWVILLRFVLNSHYFLSSNLLRVCFFNSLFSFIFIHSGIKVPNHILHLLFSIFKLVQFKSHNCTSQGRQLQGGRCAFPAALTLTKRAMEQKKQNSSSYL